MSLFSTFSPHKKRGGNLCSLLKYYIYRLLGHYSHNDASLLYLPFFMDLKYSSFIDYLLFPDPLDEI